MVVITPLASLLTNSRSMMRIVELSTSSISAGAMRPLNLLPGNPTITTSTGQSPITPPRRVSQPDRNGQAAPFPYWQPVPPPYRPPGMNPRRTMAHASRPQVPVSLGRCEQMGEPGPAEEGLERPGQMAERVGKLPRHIAPSMSRQVRGDGEHANQHSDHNEATTGGLQPDC